MKFASKILFMYAETCSLFVDQISDDFKELWLDKVFNDTYFSAGIDAITYTDFGENMNIIQWEFQCCGVRDPEDYRYGGQWPKRSLVCDSVLFFRLVINHSFVMP